MLVPPIGKHAEIELNKQIRPRDTTTIKHSNYIMSYAFERPAVVYAVGPCSPPAACASACSCAAQTRTGCVALSCAQ